MMNGPLEISQIASLIKSCVLSKKVDMTLQDLEGEYHQLVGEDIPFKSVGYESLEDLLITLPGIKVIEKDNGEVVVIASSEKSAHIASLVAKSKTPRKDKWKGKFVRNIKKSKRKRNQKNLIKDQPYNNSSRANTNSFVQNKCKSYGSKRFSANEKGNRRHLHLTPLLSQTKVRILVTEDEDNDGSCDILSEGEMEDLTRNVTFTGNTLKCTISSNSTSSQIVLPAASYNLLENTAPRSNWDYGPILLGHHLVGDDFLLQFAYECLHVEYGWEDAERLSCGMCISGQTIQDFHQQLIHEGIIPPKVIIMLGAVDFLQSNPLRYIIDSMTDLLEAILLTAVESVIVVTLPFLMNGGQANRKLFVFNEFLKTLNLDDRLHVLDAHPLFNRRNNSIDDVYGFGINAKCFERFANDIFGFPNGVVLWSRIGRSYLYNFLLQEITELQSFF